MVLLISASALPVVVGRLGTDLGLQEPGDWRGDDSHAILAVGLLPRRFVRADAQVHDGRQLDAEETGRRHSAGAGQGGRTTGVHVAPEPRRSQSRRWLATRGGGYA